jgi:Asp-tRNA(Asn)/Glu-tRNA(Gln) amidotransferase A subunit family amidase
MCRSAEDCALVFDAIIGPDGRDLTIKDYPFNWNANVKPANLRIGYVKATFDLPERGANNQLQHATKAQDDAAIEVLQRLGAKLIPVELPPTNGAATGLILQPEAGAAFETLILSGKVKELVQQGANAWPNTFRAAQFVPAVDYINANRARAMLMQAWWELFQTVDVIVTPTGGNAQLGQTNLTGNPSVIVPNGFREAPALGGGGAGAPRPDSTAPVAPRPQTPVSLTFLGPLFQEELPLAVAHAYQQATDFHLRRPPGF